MKGWSTKIARWFGGLIRPRPSLFDLCLAGYLITPFIKDTTIQEIYFIFYSIFLTCISIGLKPRRDYRSIPLMLLTLWAFAGVFIHSFVIPCEESTVRRYINMYLMSEGFIYTLFSALLITMVVKHSKNIKIFYVLIPIAMIHLVKRAMIEASMTFLFSIVVAIIIYLLLRRKFTWAITSINLGILLAAANISTIKTKWVARPYVWKQLLLEIKKHPFVGSGFYHELGHPNNMIWVEQDGYGWLWRHNDWLSLAAFLGILALVFMLWFYISSIRKIGIRLALIPILAIGIMSCFQLNMFHLDRASVYLLTGALCISQAYKKEAAR